MPIAVADGIRTRYEISGQGPPLLMFSPGGFDSQLENWSSLGKYAGLGLLPALAQRYTCITFDRRESGQSGGRLQRLRWSDYVAHAVGLLDELGLRSAYLMGGCVGCSGALAMGISEPDRVDGLVLYSPAGGPRYRMNQHSRFGAHAAFVAEHGLPAVVERARSSDLGFTKDPAVGPWAPVVRSDPDFARGYAAADRDDYLVALAGTARTLYDRDTVPGAEPEDLLRLAIPALVVPGRDDSHPISAARYLEECLPQADYWDVPVAEQTAQTAPRRVLGFLDGIGR